jgi:hypothetical protein
MSAASDIFTSSSAFETYLSQLTDRLSAEREARVAFLTAAIDKLSPLLDLARSLQSERAIAEVESHLSAARAELSTLQQQAP